MNKIYRLTWSVITGTWVAVPENSRSGGRTASARRAAVRAGAVAVTVLGVGSGAAFAQPAPTALPTGGQVVAGQAGIQQQGATLTVHQQSDRAAIDWATFNVGSQGHVQFVQPSATSVTLNRVQGGNESQIFGRITANGQVFLSNPNGVYFSPGASVDVGGLVATTHRIGLDDFMAGTLRFERQGATGSVVNEGELKAALGGYIALLAPEVRNQGVILAHMGTVALAAGEAFELRIDGGRTLAGLRVEPATMRALVDNRSAVLAPGGLVILSAQALDRVQGGVVRNSGRIEATGLAQRGGRIVLEASDRIENTGTLSANASAEGPAGSVSLVAPEIVNTGTVEATGSAAHGTGGSIAVDAGTLVQAATGRLDVSAPAQGGTVAVQATQQVTLAGHVDASGRNDASHGGQVALQAPQVDVAHANVDASGGAQGGQVMLHADAAMVASPGPAFTTAAPADPPAPPSPPPRPGHLALTGNTLVDTRGRRGQGGTATLLGDHITLLDTTVLDASGATGGGQVYVGGGWQGGGGLHQATTVTMGTDTRIHASATQQGDGGTVAVWSDITKAESLTTVDGRIQARGGSAGGDGGQIETSGHVAQIDGARIDAGADRGTGGLWLIDPSDTTITQTVANGYANTLNTGTSVINDVTGSITWNSGVTLNTTAGGVGNRATLTLRSTNGNGASPIALNTATIAATGGALNLVLWTRYNATGGNGTVSINGSSINTNGGHVWIGGGNTASTAWNGLTVGDGQAATWATTTVAVYLGGSTISTAGGHFSANALSWYSGGGANTWSHAILMDASSISTGAGNLSLTGDTRGNYDGGASVELRNLSALTTTSGTISVRGTASSTNTPTDRMFGLSLHNRTTVSSDSGAINLYGVNNANSVYGAGIWLGSTSSIGGTANGNQTSGVGDGYNVAVVSNSGAVLLDAQAASTYATNWSHALVAIAYGADRQLIKTTSGNITLKGDANVTRDDSSGVQFQVNASTGNIHVVSTSGDIYMQGYQHSGSSASANNAMRFTPGDSDGSIRFGAVTDGATYTGKLTFEADSIWNNTANTSRAGAIRAYGSGDVAFQSSGATSVKDFSLVNAWGFGNGHSGFSIGKPTETRNVTLTASLTAAGPLTIYGGDITLDSHLTSTLAGSAVRLMATGSIFSLTNANTITTNAGAVMLSSDTDGSGFGNIRFGQGLTIDTRSGLAGSKSTAQTGGASITLGGGNLFGTGYASGISALGAEGVRVDNGFTARSGGGDINLRGRSWVGTVGSEHGAWGVGFWGGSMSLTLDSGAGRVRMEGIGRSSGSGAYKEGIATTQTVDILSSHAGADAITLIGNVTATTGGWLVGVDLGVNNAVASVNQQRIAATGVGGGITIQGQATDDAVSIRSGTQLLTNGGDLRLIGTGNNARLNIANGNNLWLGSMASSLVTTSSSNLLMEFDRFEFNVTYPNIATTGAVAVRSTSASFAQSFHTQWMDWNQNGQTISGLSIGRATNSAQTIAFDGSNANTSATLTVNGLITAYGSTVTVSSPLVAAGNVYLESLAGNLALSSTLSKTSGADATATFRATGSVNVASGISASGGGTGKLNMVFWSDSDANRAGGDTFGSHTYASNGGHIWVGGSATPGGSTTWNGLTVGNGASSGSYGANYNGIDLAGTFNTIGGDFYAAGKSYVATASNWDINATGASVVVNAGAGNVTFVGNRIDFGGIYTANVTTSVTTTGTLAIRPYEDSFTNAFNVRGGVSGSDWLGTTISTVSNDGNSNNRASAALSNNLTGTANLIVRNVASLGGLVIGKATNASAISVRNNLSIAGDMSLYGGRIANVGSASLTSTAGNLLLDADLDRTLNFSGAGILWNGGALTASSTAGGRGNITLTGRGGTTANADNHGVMLDNSATLNAGGDVNLTGRAAAASNAGVFVGGNASATAGRTLTGDGRNIASVSSASNQGLRVLSGGSLTSTGAMTLRGQAGTGTTRAVQLNNGASLTTTGTAGTSGITLEALNGGSIASGGTGAVSVTAGAGSGITLTSDRLDFAPTRSMTLATTGVLTFQSQGTSFADTFTLHGSLAGADLVGTGSLNGITVNGLASLGGLTLGKAGNGSHIVVSAPARAAGPIELHGRDLTLNAALTASGHGTAATNRILLDASGNVTQTAALTAHGLGLQGGGRFTLDHTGNDVTVLAAGSGGTPVGRVAFVDANGVAIGSVGALSGITSSGTVRVETLAGDVSLGASVASGSTAHDAVVLNAGRAKGVADGDFFTGAGGHLTVHNGATVTVGTGGRATLYTGSLTGSTGLADLVGSGSGRFRYASDEVTSNYLAPLGTGLHAVYREQPTITLRGVDESVAYGTDPSLAVGASGLLHGDSVSLGLGRLPSVTLTDGGATATRNARGHFNVRRDSGSVSAYGMALSRNAVSSLGYALNYDDTGATTVTPKALTAVINDDAKFVGLADNAGYAGATFSGFARGESAADLNASALITRSGMGANQGTGDALGTHSGALTGAVTVAAGNYVLDPSAVTAGTYHIVDPNTLIVRVGSAEAVYGGTASYDVAQVRYYNTLTHAEVSLGQGSSEFNWNLAGNGSQAIDFSLASAGIHVGTHGITGTVTAPHTLPGTASGSTPGQLLAIGGRLAITPRTVTLTASKTYDGNAVLGAGTVTLGNLHNGETLGYTGALANDRNVATAGKYVAGIALADGTGLASNYQLPGLSAAAAGSNTVNITARELGVQVDKVYDGLASATSAQTVLTNLAAGESLALLGVTLSNAHVATAGKYVSGLSLADQGPYLLGNYSLPSLTAAGARNSVGITPQTLTVSVASASTTDKTYDGTTATAAGFAATLVVDGYLAGDGGTVSHGGAYDTRGVDASRIVLTGLSLGGITTSVGSQASDYALDGGNAFTAGSITARTVTAATAANPTKVYDGTTGVDGAVVALAAATSSTGQIGGDDLSIVAVGGSFNSADAGTSRSYTLADISLGGSDARNYVLSSGTISGTDGVITPRQLTLNATKVYDGTTTLASVALGNLASGEYLGYSAVTVRNAHVAGPDGDVATDDNFVRNITLSNVMDGGTPVYKTANYSLPGGSTGITSGAVNVLNASTGNTAAVTAAALTVSLAETQVSKVYDGTANAAAGYTPGYVVTGLVSGDSAASLTQASSLFDAATVAGASTFTLSGITVASVTGSSSSVASDYTLSATNLSLPGTITARAVAVDVAVGIRKTYDAATGFNNLAIGLTSVSGNASSGLIAGDTGLVAVVATGGGFDTKDAGSGKSYTLTGLSLDGSGAGNYVIASGSSMSGLNGVVDPKQISVSGLSTVSKAYDGHTTAAAYGGVAGSLLSVAPGGNTAGDGRYYVGDTVVLQGAPTSGTYNSKDVATANRVTFSGYSLTGLDAANYSVVASTGASITPKALGATPVLAAKTYDATTSVTVNSTTLSGLVGSETLGVSGTGVLDNANAGSRTATLGFVLASGSHGGLASNYSLADMTQGVTVATKVLTMTGTTVAGKTYDGNATAAVTLGGLSGFVGSQTVTASASGLFDSANAGSRTATVSYTLADGSHGGLAANYSLASQGGMAATIAARTLTLSGAKVYDGSTALTGSQLTLGGLVGSETLGYTGATASDAHVATAGKHVSGLTLTDGTGLAGNYQLPTLNAANAAVTITAKAINATAAIGGVHTKVYDGTTIATGAAVTGNVSGAVSGDTLTLDTSGITLAYDAAHVASATQITASGSAGFTIGGSNGSQASDYSFTTPTLNAVSASITPATLTATLANTGVTKVYDGSTSAPTGFAPTWSVNGLVSGDSAASLTHTASAYDSKDVTSATQVTVSGIALSGITGSNGSALSDYALSASTADAAATITAKTVTLSGSKTYDGSTSLTGSQLTLGGLVNSETLGYTGATVSDAHVATAGKHVSALTLTDGTGLASNYQLPSLNAANAAVTITAKAIAATATIGGALTKSYDGTTAATGATVSGSVTGAVAGDTLSLDDSSLTLAYDSAHVASATQIIASGSASFSISGSNGSQASDYSFTTPTLNAVSASITPATLTATLTASLTNTGVTKVYDGSTSAPIGFAPTWSVSGLVGGDSAASLTHTASAYDSKDVATATQVTVSGMALGGITGTNGSALSDYALSSSTADAAASITAKALTLSGSKVYDGTTSLAAGQFTVGGLVGAETLSYSGVTVNDAHVAIAGKHIDAITLADGSQGGLAGNYRLPTLDAAHAAVTITPKAVNATATLGGTLTKAYDGTTTATGATLTGGVTGAVAGDTLSLDTSGVTLAYDSAHVAGATQIAAHGTLGLAISGSHGSQASDYSFTAPTVSAVAAHITPATLTATLANSGVTKVYDGSTSAPAGFTPGWSFTGFVAGDSAASLTHAGAAYDSKDVATAGQLTVSGLAVGGITGSLGSALSDYALSATSASTTATITRRDVTVTGFTVAGKTYDGTTNAPVTDWGDVSTGVGSETLNLEGAIAAFADPNAGTAKTVTATGYALAHGSHGGLAGNYRLTATTASTTADITQALLTVVANNDAKFVSFADGAGYSGVSLTGFVHGETTSVLGGTAQVTRSNSGTNTAGVYTGVLVADVSGLSAANYSFTTQNGDFTIVPSNQLLVRVAPTSTVYGSAAAYTVSSAAYFDGSTVHPVAFSPASGANAFTVDDGAGASAHFTLLPQNATASSGGHTRVGAYQLGAGALWTTNPQNFSNTFTIVGAHTVTTKGLGADAVGGVSKVYDGTTAMQSVQIGLTGLEAGDLVSASGNGAFASKNAGSSLAYTVGNLALGDADAGNYHLTGGTTFSGTNGSITPRALSVAVSTAGKVYDGQSTAAFNTTDDRIDGDAFAILGSAAFDDKNVGTGKTVTVSGLSLSGLDAANYTVGTTAQTTADVTRLGSVTWIGGSSGNWFDPANWAGGAVPDLANVANVVIPDGVTVSFDTSGAVSPAATGPVSIDGLGSAGSLQQHDGSLNVGTGGVTLHGFAQSGGSFHSDGDIQLQTFAQTGGSTATAADLVVQQDFSQGPHGAVTVGGDLRITDTLGGTTLGNLQVTGALDVTSTGGDVTQSGGTALIVAGDTTVDAGSANIVLNGPANDFQGAFNAQGHDVTVQDGTGGLVLGNVTASGGLVATSTGGDLTQSAGSAIAVAGTTTVDAGTDDIVLSGPANDFLGAVHAQGHNITLRDGAGGLSLGDVTASGNVDATSSGGDLTQAPGSTIVVAGTTTVDAGVDDIVLDGTANDFQGAFHAHGGGTISVRDEVGGFMLGNVTAGSLQATSAGGDMTQTGGSTLAVSGNAMLTAPGGDILIATTGNSFGSLTTPGSDFADRLAPPRAATALPDPQAPLLALPIREDAPPTLEDAPTPGGDTFTVEVTALGVDSTVEEITVTVSKVAALSGFSFELPASLTAALPPGAPAVAKRESGRALPDWLAFDAARHSFSVHAVPPRRLPLRMTVMLNGRPITVVLVTSRARQLAKVQQLAAEQES